MWSLRVVTNIFHKAKKTINLQVVGLDKDICLSGDFTVDYYRLFIAMNFGNAKWSIDNLYESIVDGSVHRLRKEVGL